MTTATCEQCGKVFQRALADIKSNVKHGRKIFCTSSCSAQYRMTTISEQTRISCVCEKCGVQFTRPASLARNKFHYCSKACYRADLKRVRNL